MSVEQHMTVAGVVRRQLRSLDHVLFYLAQQQATPEYCRQTAAELQETAAVLEELASVLRSHGDQNEQHTVTDGRA
jgi:hypothetical protein